jgi:hypothetical protein
MKRQEKLALDKASKFCGFMKQISVLEDKVSGLMAKIVHLLSYWYCRVRL